MSSQLVYFFGNGVADGAGDQKELLGGKGAGLAEMTRLGIPVPPGFTITTEVCLDFQRNSRRLPVALVASVQEALGRVEAITGTRFGDAENPLLLSVRSGARASMPGMMDTVLNIGLNEKTVQGLTARTANARFAWDSYRRFTQMFGNVVLGVGHDVFERELTRAREAAGVRHDHQLDTAALRSLVGTYRERISETTRHPFPDDPMEQLLAAIRAVFDSWHNDRAQAYRELNNIPHTWGTAANVQAMVFGNKGDDCATGVAFTRNPATGERRPFGEYLANAQGEDVVAGIRTPLPVAGVSGDGPSLEEAMPAAWKELAGIMQRLESHFREMQDIEFTIEHGRVWMLQTRAGKRTARAAVRIAVEMAQEGVINRDEAVLRVDPAKLDALLHPALDPAAPRTVVGRGLPASPGAATGRIVFTAEEAEKRAAAGTPVILVRAETSPEDIRGMSAAQGILTSRGGMTSHAAVVARQMGRCCVVGCTEATVDEHARTLRFTERSFSDGDTLTLDGSTGEVIAGDVPRVPPSLSEHYEILMQWADERRRIRVRTNADRGPDAALARRLGAEGIGLTRTEHMFFEGDRINVMREMILAQSVEARIAALEKLRPFQQGDFEEIFRAMDGFPVTIRLLDPPLHEFLPVRDEDIADLSRRMGVDVAEVRRVAEKLREANPMLGHRGCRLGVTFPEIYDMQARAIFAAAERVAGDGVRALPEIMIPLVSVATELVLLRGRIESIRAEFSGRCPELAQVRIGTMIELPRACATADEIAAHADFFSFGTNDLTQTTFGFSRDDVSTFLPEYIARGVLARDPFATLDTVGVGEMIKMACFKGRKVKPGLKIGICGEHGGDPDSVAWVQRGYVDYVSCSPYRVPIARLAAAQAAIRDGFSA